MITLKIKYKCEEPNYSSLILTYQRQYSSCLHFMFNRISDNPKISEIALRELSKQINNINLLDSWFAQSSIKEAKQIYNSAKEHTEDGKGIKVIFGGKKLFNKRCKNKISKEEFQLKRLSPLYSIG